MGRNCTWVNSAKGEGAAHPWASARSVVRDTGRPACGWAMKRRPVEADPGLGCCGGPRGAGPSLALELGLVVGSSGGRARSTRGKRGPGTGGHWQDLGLARPGSTRVGGAGGSSSTRSCSRDRAVLGAGVSRRRGWGGSRWRRPGTGRGRGSDGEGSILGAGMEAGCTGRGAWSFEWFVRPWVSC